MAFRIVATEGGLISRALRRFQGWQIPLAARVSLKGNVRLSLYLPLLIALQGVVSVAYADSPAPKDFYQKDFAAAPAVQHEPMLEVSPPKPGMHKMPRGASEDAEEGVNQALPGGPAPATAASDERERIRREVMPQTMLTLFVNSKDPEHLKNVLKKAIDVADKNRVFLASVFHIGDYRNVPDNLLKKLQQLGCHVLPLQSIPEEFPVTQSPAWVFQSASGYQIVEGTLAIEQFVDQNGDFIEPETFVNPEEVRPPTRKETGRSEGF